MKRSICLMAFLFVTGCGDVNRSHCIYTVRQAYCKPVGNDYDCSSVNNTAYDAAIKACIDSTR